MARTIAEMIAPKVTEQDKTMVDVYGLKSKAADDIQEETQSWLSSFIFGPESGVDMGYAPDIALTPFFSKKGILAALKKFGIGKKGMRQVGKFNRQLNDPKYVYQKNKTFFDKEVERTLRKLKKHNDEMGYDTFEKMVEKIK